jgi:hypothetical protein
MSYLINEILLRFVKPLGAGLVGVILYAVALTLLGQTGSFQLAALCWVSGAALILLMESGPL